jgi:hypothetical protein
MLPMVDSKLFNHWILTGKENNGIKVYTPKKATSTDGQKIENEDSFEIKENGEFIKYMKSTDGTQRPYVGRYDIQGDTLHVFFKNHYLDTMFTILALDDNNVLKIR